MIHLISVPIDTCPVSQFTPFYDNKNVQLNIPFGTQAFGLCRTGKLFHFPPSHFTRRTSMRVLLQMYFTILSSLYCPVSLFIEPAEDIIVCHGYFRGASQPIVRSV